MNKALIDILVTKFKESYPASEKDAIWKQQSSRFRDFWSGRVMAQGSGTIPDEASDKIIQILDRHGKGNTKKSEVVARTMVTQDTWRKLFNHLHVDQKLTLLVDSILKENNLEHKAKLINDLFAANEGKKNHLTGETATTINALLAAYDPFKNLSSASLNHRKLQMDFLGLKIPFDWDTASIGQRIVQSNALLCKATRNLGVDGTARTLGGFWYFEPVKELWDRLLNLDVDIHQHTATEGNRRLVLHLRRERNPAIVRKKKKLASSLDCEVCNFSFNRAYGNSASHYCEVHHLIPLSEVEHVIQTRMEDLAILCANCHRVVHLRNPPHTLDEVRKMLKI